MRLRIGEAEGDCEAEAEGDCEAEAEAEGDCEAEAEAEAEGHCLLQHERTTRLCHFINN
jgi:hypothetical protein